MNEFIYKLTELVASNRINEVISILLQTFSHCEAKYPKSKENIRELRNTVVLLSSRFNENSAKINSGTIDSVTADTTKNQIISAFLNLISDFSNYNDFVYYLNDLEEEKEWERVSEKNTIDGYKEFFNRFPNGKYKEETKRIITELEEINRKKELEIKQRAQEERNRREQEEVEERIVKEQIELNKKQEVERIERQQAELKQKQENEKKAIEEAELKQKKENEKKAKEQAELIQKQENEKTTKEHAKLRQKQENEKIVSEKAELKRKQRDEENINIINKPNENEKINIKKIFIVGSISISLILVIILIINKFNNKQTDNTQKIELSQKIEMLISKTWKLQVEGADKEGDVYALANFFAEKLSFGRDINDKSKFSYEKKIGEGQLSSSILGYWELSDDENFIIMKEWDASLGKEKLPENYEIVELTTEKLILKKSDNTKLTYIAE